MLVRNPPVVETRDDEEHCESRKLRTIPQAYTAWLRLPLPLEDSRSKEKDQKYGGEDVHTLIYRRFLIVDRFFFFQYYHSKTRVDSRHLTNKESKERSSSAPKFCKTLRLESKFTTDKAKLEVRESCYWLTPIIGVSVTFVHDLSSTLLSGWRGNPPRPKKS